MAIPSNPLATVNRPAKDHPAMMHAQVWKHVSAMPAGELPEKIARVDHILPILGSLAGNPNVKPRDVIKAAASVAADGIVSPSDAVSFISQMPADPDKVQGWLKGLYAANLSAAVHMKAAVMQQSQGAPQAPQPMTPGAGA